MVFFKCQLTKQVTQNDKSIVQRRFFISNMTRKVNISYDYAHMAICSDSQI